MSKVKSLQELTEKEFNILKESGMLKTIYPDAPDTFKELKPEVPEPLENPDYTNLRDTCKGYLNELHEKGYANEDYSHYIFEEAMNAIYGKDVWKFINKKLK